MEYKLVKTGLFTLAAVSVMLAGNASAQNNLAFNGSPILATADTTASGGSAADTKDEEADLAKKLQNPVAALISVPLQNNWDFGLGTANAMKYTCNIQPVVPIGISDNWNLIIRTIMPVIYQDPLDNSPKAPASLQQSHAGLGDITQSFFLSPKEPVGGWILGAGPVMYYPAATDSALGAGKWGAGPTVVALQQTHGFTYGILANQIWSYAGWGPQNVNATYLQPFVGYTTKTYTTFTLNSESTYDWQAGQWTVPINVMVQQLIKIGKQPIALQVGYRYYAQRPAGGADWGLRFAVTFLFPKK